MSCVLLDETKSSNCKISYKVQKKIKFIFSSHKFWNGEINLLESLTNFIGNLDEKIYIT